MEKRKLIMAIDYNNFVMTSYYSQKLMNSKGMNVNAIKGTFFKLKMLKENFNPDYIVFASDISRDKTFRRKLYKKYKAQRKPMDLDIKEQMKYVSQIIALLGFPVINDELYEADDVLGMIAKYANENNMDCIIISSDRDLYQLINDHTFIMSPRSSDVVDTAYLVEKYRLMPNQWIELKMIQGDNSDNIPGIRGIGEHGALKLLQEYVTLDGIYTNMKNHKPGIQKCLIEGEPELDLLRQLVTIISDHTILNINEEMFVRKEEYPQEIIDLIVDLEIPSLINVFNYSLFSEPIYINTDTLFGPGYMLP